MKKLHPLAFAALTLPLILAACGSASTPTAALPASPVATQPTSAALVKLSLHAPVGLLAQATKLASSIKAQGLPTDPSNTLPALHFNVQVRDSAGTLVAFNNGTYDPTGAGSTTVLLNSTNGFGQTLLLPAGSYTFENAVKDDATSGTLLAYGPATENAFTVSGDGSAVLLKFHAVYNPANSKLDFGTNTPHLFTNTTFNLNLFAKSSFVNGASYAIPTSDLGAVTYALESSTDGTLNGTGSKLGVNLTATGTTSDSTLNVTAGFSAWIQNGSADTASYQPTTLSFSKAIETNALGADTTMPGVSFTAVSSAVVGQATTLSGTATDDQMVGSVKLYDNLNLVASSDSNDGVTALTSDGTGAWSTSWTPAQAGSHDLTVVVADSSGNETHSTQTVTAIVQTYDHQLNYGTYGGYDYASYTIPAHSESWIKVNTNGWTGSNGIYTNNYFSGYNSGCSGGYSNSSALVSMTYGPTAADQTPMNPLSCYGFQNYPVLPGASTFFVHAKNISDYSMNLFIEAFQD